jgi:hypothetical protein
MSPLFVYRDPCNLTWQELVVTMLTWQRAVQRSAGEHIFQADNRRQFRVNTHQRSVSPIKRRQPLSSQGEVRMRSHARNVSLSLDSPAGVEGKTSGNVFKICA